MIDKIREVDFTEEKYRKLCNTIIASGYRTVTVRDYLKNMGQADRTAIIRHDIDRKPQNALKIATLEHDLGISATYYFRATREVFQPEIIKAIGDMGHEIGYHYETLSDAKGDYEKAIELFAGNLEQFRKLASIDTICMHGAPISPYDNRDLWKKYDFKDYGLLGEAYLSAGSDLYYFSDTGRTWDMGGKVRDKLPTSFSLKADTTDALINIVASGRMKKLYLLTHPERWSDSDSEWAINYAKDYIFGVGKKAVSTINSR